ncbi:hypothetical protein QIO_0427 [Clostridioides difficile DA00129]|nr:hypothetical protein QIO_0427 [Clostridioides difficile DA00129]
MKIMTTLTILIILEYNSNINDINLYHRDIKKETTNYLL